MNRFAALITQLRDFFYIKRLDRYIIKKFMSTYFFLIVIIVLITIIFDFNEHIDKLTAANVSARRIIFDYYLNFVPFLTNLFCPLFVFIAVIFFTSNLADHSEIIAMKAAGLSYKRLLRPYMFSATIIALLTLVLGAYVIPKGNVAKVNFENTYFKKKPISVVENVLLQVDTGVVAYIRHFDNARKTGTGFSLDKFQNKKVVSRLTAQVITYDTLSDHRYHWTLHQYQLRTLKGMREQITSGVKLDSVIRLEPSDFVYTEGRQETMTSPELREYIEKQRMRGASNLSIFEVEYHKRFATTFAAFILTIIGASLSCQKRKGGGMGTSIGIGLALSFSYILFQTVSSSLAVNAGFPPMLAAWTPNIIFALIAVAVYKQTPP